MNCIKCGKPYDNGGDVRRKYCDACRKQRHGKRDIDTAARLEQHEVTFVGFDGEGVTGACLNKECDCKVYKAADPDDDRSACICGHRKLPYRVPGTDILKTGNGHDHSYVLMRCGNYALESPDGITTIRMSDALGFLYFTVAPNYPRESAYVVYSGGYDLIQLWKTVPQSRVARVLLNEQRAARKNLPVDYPYANPQWQVDALNSTFRFRPYDESKRIKAHSKDEGWMHLCDVFPFYQRSFLRAIDPSKYPAGTAPCTAEVYDKIKEGKDRRDIAELNDDMREYNRLEVETLANLMAGFNRELVRIGIRLKRNEWYGPGAVAAKMLRKWGVPRCEELDKMIADGTMSQQAYDAWHASYVAGWFEIFVHGNVRTRCRDMFNLPDRLVYEYDINSAYPFVISKLPCLRHGTWSYGNNYMTGNYDKLPELPDRGVRLIYAAVHGSNPYAGAMLHRLAFGNHQIIRPHNTAGWYKQEELEAACRAGLIDRVEYKEWHTYEPCDCAPPLREIQGMYERRLAVGKDTPEGKALKLGPNSIYGKFAQQIGKHPYLNWIYASMITSGCRTMILEAIAHHPDGMKAVAKIATDGIYFLSPNPWLDQQISEKLGEWASDTHTAPTFFMSGFDWDYDTAVKGSGEIKSRGVNKGEALKQANQVIREWGEWDQSKPWPVMKVHKPFEIYSPIQLMRWGTYGLHDGYGQGVSKWHAAGVVFESGQTLSSNPLPKRRVCSGCRTPYHHDDECDRDGMYVEDGLWRSRVFEAGQLSNGEPGPSLAYTHIRSLREVLNDNPLESGFDTDGDVWNVILEEFEMK